MEIKCTPQELIELLKKEQTECKSECSSIDIKLTPEKLCDEIVKSLATCDIH